ncbi:MAG TPA: beta/gamma crystallin-related protein [Acidobacteriota bacterium]|nr:beta/gamma crystallin-related protein [Acidobacteriota bacterium]
MRNYAWIVVLFIAGSLAPIANGNNDEDLRGGSGYIIAYKDEGFEGKSKRFPIGEYKKLKDGWDDDIESVQIVGDVRVTLFDDDDFEGDKLLLEHSAYELEDLDEEAESMIVEPFNCSSVTVYKKTEFRGKSKTFQAGEYPKLEDGWSGSIESVDLCGGLKVTLYEDENFAGPSLQIEQDQMDLDDFNKKAESMIVER